MTQQKQSFRFRFPWSTTSNPPPPRPPTQSKPRRSPTETKTSTQPTKARPPIETEIPSQPNTSPSTQKPFKPAGIAQPRPSPKTKPQSPSPNRLAIESQVVSQTASPSSAPSQTQTTSLSLSPSPKTTESRVSSKIQLTSRAKTPTQSPKESQISSQIQLPSSLASQPTSKTLHISSPSHRGIQAQPTDGAVSLSSFSPDKSQPTDQKSSQPLTSSTPPQSNNSQDPKVKMSQQPIQESKPSLETFGTTHAASNTIAITPPSQTDRRARKELKDVSLPVAMTNLTSTKEVIGSYKKLDANSNARAPMLHSKLEVKSNEECNEIVKELPKEETNKGEPVHKTVTEVTVSNKQVKDAKSDAIKEEKRQHKQESMDTEEKVPFASSIGKKLQTSSSSYANTSNVSTKEPYLSIEEQDKLHKEIREDIPKIVHKIASRHQIDEKLVNVITLCGENRGTTMHLSSETEKEAPIHIHRGYKINQDDNLETTNLEEVNIGGESFKKNGERENLRPRACVNSNVQSVNNSFVFNSHVTERDPGVEVIFSHHAAESIKRNGKPESAQTRKAEFTITPAEKLTHEHSVKRGCLRGLFAEPSDLDPNNLAKPQLHGCHYNFREKSKDADHKFPSQL